jgi:hypothetical protein
MITVLKVSLCVESILKFRVAEAGAALRIPGLNGSSLKKKIQIKDQRTQ